VIAVAGHVNHVFQERIHVVLSNVINRPAGWAQPPSRSQVSGVSQRASETGYRVFAFQAIMQMQFL
jgi:hypothetical protein